MTEGRPYLRVYPGDWGEPDTVQCLTNIQTGEPDIKHCEVIYEMPRHEFTRLFGPLANWRDDR